MKTKESKCLQSNLTWTFMALNLDLLGTTEQTYVNNHKSNYKARSYQEDTGGDMEAMPDRLFANREVLSFFLKEATDVTPCTLSGRSFQILGASNTKLWPKSLT